MRPVATEYGGDAMKLDLVGSRALARGIVIREYRPAAQLEAPPADAQARLAVKLPLVSLESWNVPFTDPEPFGPSVTVAVAVEV